MSTNPTPRSTAKRRQFITTAAIMLFCCGSFLSNLPDASAYGGGFPGFPPGWLHNHKKHCETRIVNLPFGRTITVPDCKKEKEREEKEKHDKFKKRMGSFVERFKRGGR